MVNLRELLISEAGAIRLVTTDSFNYNIDFRPLTLSKLSSYKLTTDEEEEKEDKEESKESSDSKDGNIIVRAFKWVWEKIKSVFNFIGNLFKKFWNWITGKKEDTEKALDDLKKAGEDTTELDKTNKELNDTAEKIKSQLDMDLDIGVTTNEAESNKILAYIGKAACDVKAKLTTMFTGGAKHAANALKIGTDEFNKTVNQLADKIYKQKGLDRTARTGGMGDKIKAKGVIGGLKNWVNSKLKDTASITNHGTKFHEKFDTPEGYVDTVISYIILLGLDNADYFKDKEDALLEQYKDNNVKRGNAIEEYVSEPRRVLDRLDKTFKEEDHKELLQSKEFKKALDLAKAWKTDWDKAKNNGDKEQKEAIIKLEESIDNINKELITKIVEVHTTIDTKSKESLEDRRERETKEHKEAKEKLGEEKVTDGAKKRVNVSNTELDTFNADSASKIIDSLVKAVQAAGLNGDILKQKDLVTVIRDLDGREVTKLDKKALNLFYGGAANLVEEIFASINKRNTIVTNYIKVLTKDQAEAIKNKSVWLKDKEEFLARYGKYMEEISETISRDFYRLWDKVNKSYLGDKEEFAILASVGYAISDEKAVKGRDDDGNDIEQATFRVSKPDHITVLKAKVSKVGSYNVLYIVGSENVSLRSN